MTGNIETGLVLAERARALAPSDPYSYYYVGLIALRAGDIGAARSALNRAVELGYPTALLAAEPYLKPLRSKRWFSNLVAIKGE